MWFVSKQKYFHVDLWQYPRFSLFYKTFGIIFRVHFDFFVLKALYQFYFNILSVGLFINIIMWKSEP